MFKYKVWLSISTVVFLAGLLSVARALDADAPWMRTSSPTVQKVVDMPAGQWPYASNIDCYDTSVHYLNTTGAQNDCLLQNAYGLASASGTVFTGSSDSVPLTPPSPFWGLAPVPGQGMYYAFSSNSYVGSNLFFYRSIRDKLPSIPELVNGRWQYTLKSNPDVSIKNPEGKLMPVNNSAMAFSSNGSWLVAEFPYYGFIRINMATFEMQPFAPPRTQGSDFNTYGAEMSITNDGRYVVIKPNLWDQLNVYDLQNCTNKTIPVASSSPPCPSRDYWPTIAKQISGLKNIGKPRFTDNTQLSIQAMYDFVGSNNYKVAQYSVTAPGENPTGMPYLGMGDSFASGQGAYDYINGTDTANSGCHLSVNAYPVMIGNALFVGAHSVACSGAETKDINSSPQTYSGQNIPHRLESELGKLNMMSSILDRFTPGYVIQKRFVDMYNPQIITLSIGGNDIGFSDIIKRCIMPSLKPTCYKTYEDQQELVSSINRVGDTLKNTYKALSGPGRRVYIIGYPQIVTTSGSCANNVHLDDSERKLFSDLTVTLNQTIKGAADAVGAQYVDVSDALVGHRMCETNSSQVAVNGLTAGNDMGGLGIKVIGAESYHPNMLGHQLLMQAILKKTNNLKGPAQNKILANTGFPYSTAPRTGRPTNISISSAGLVPNSLAQTTVVPLNIDATVAQLRAAVPFSVRLDTGTASIGTASTDNLGQLSGNVTIPSSTSCGYHTLHVTGPNILNQSVDMYKTIYVSTPNSDCDNNGQLDSVQACGQLPASGTDSDDDGIDDGCDPLISDPPPSRAYQVYLTGSSIHATKP